MTWLFMTESWTARPRIPSTMVLFLAMFAIMAWVASPLDMSLSRSRERVLSLAISLSIIGPARLMFEEMVSITLACVSGLVVTILPMSPAHPTVSPTTSTAAAIMRFMDFLLYYESRIGDSLARRT